MCVGIVTAVSTILIIVIIIMSSKWLNRVGPKSYSCHLHSFALILVWSLPCRTLIKVLFSHHIAYRITHTLSALSAVGPAASTSAPESHPPPPPSFDDSVYRYVARARANKISSEINVRAKHEKRVLFSRIKMDSKFFFSSWDKRNAS